MSPPEPPDQMLDVPTLTPANDTLASCLNWVGLFAAVVFFCWAVATALE